MTIIEVCHVPPFSNSFRSTPTELSLPLNFSDIFNLRFPPVQSIFFYKLGESTTTFFKTVILPRIKHSLSITLFHFLPLAGHLSWPQNSEKPIIIYNTADDGVSLTVAESGEDLDHLYSDIRYASESHPYLAPLSVSETKASILSFQITLFPNKGFTIGYTFNHAVVDGRSLSLFMNSWACICRNLDENVKICPSSLPEELYPSFDRTVIQGSDGLEMKYLNYWLGLKLPGSDASPRSLKPIPFPVPADVVRATFPFSREDIKKLGEWVQSKLENGNQTKPFSTFVLAYAYTLVCMVKAKGLKNNNKVRFGLTADCRPRLNPPLSRNYIGNCVNCCDVLVEAEHLLEENGVVYVAKRLNEMIKGLEDGVLEMAKEKVPFMDVEPGVRVILVTGSSRYGMYGADFGWGRPMNVETTTIDVGESFSMMESRDESGGVEIGLVLKKHEMEMFDSLFVHGLKSSFECHQSVNIKLNEFEELIDRCVGSGLVLPACN
ncbi:5-AROMATIC ACYLTRANSFERASE putative-RELATED [Salix viminalis]|uniref:5-AROMATIC ACYLTRANSFERASE putative-RELATED n=1 Tax=Salix viminalis TaxID=40686 RepID=A0A9Q0TAK1_SALVM|nr:5-AROMATIC ACYLTRANSFERASE putative-RELATED [Salix viminalis]